MKKLCLILAVLVCLLAATAGVLNGQMATPPQLRSTRRVPIVAGSEVGPPRIPAYNEIYCSGFISDRKISQASMWPAAGKA